MVNTDISVVIKEVGPRKFKRGMSLFNPVLLTLRSGCPFWRSRMKVSYGFSCTSYQANVASHHTSVSPPCWFPFPMKLEMIILITFPCLLPPPISCHSFEKKIASRDRSFTEFNILCCKKSDWKYT